MPLVNVANKMGVSVLMQSPPLLPHGIPAFSYKIAGNRDPGAVGGHGITYDVDETTYTEWIAANPSIARELMLVTDEQIAAAQDVDPMTTHGFELGLVPVEPVVPPVNVDIPFIWQEEQRMRTTVGNWENEPTSYGYQWMQDGTLPIGPDNDTLPMLAANDGHTITCIVTATNTAGATAAPPSNALLYTAPVEATAALLISGDFDDAAWNAMIAQIGSNTSAWQGFDVVVDGLNLTLRAQFPTITTAQDICGVINAQLGAWLTASVVTTDAPWQFNIHSNTTGVTSTISYAAAPSYLAGAERKATTDLSLVMRLRQSVGAIVVQGIDASGAARAGRSGEPTTSG